VAKKTQWGKKNISLLVIVILLGLAVIYDQLSNNSSGTDKPELQSQKELNNNPTGLLGMIPKNIYQAKLKRNQQIVASETIIHKNYTHIAIPYAMAMAELQTFRYDSAPERGDAEKLIRKLLPDDGSVIIEELTINNELIENKTFQYMATLKLKIYTHASALAVLESLGHYKKGLVWDDFSLLAHHKEKYLSLSGHLKVLFIQAVE